MQYRTGINAEIGPSYSWPSRNPENAKIHDKPRSQHGGPQKAGRAKDGVRFKELVGLAPDAGLSGPAAGVAWGGGRFHQGKSSLQDVAVKGTRRLPQMQLR